MSPWTPTGLRADRFRVLAPGRHVVRRLCPGEAFVKLKTRTTRSEASSSSRFARMRAWYTLDLFGQANSTHTEAELVEGVSRLARLPSAATTRSAAWP
jgi:hypothetical protein